MWDKICDLYKILEINLTSFRMSNRIGFIFVLGTDRYYNIPLALRLQAEKKVEQSLDPVVLQPSTNPYHVSYHSLEL